MVDSTFPEILTTLETPSTRRLVFTNEKVVENKVNGIQSILVRDEVGLQPLCYFDCRPLIYKINWMVLGSQKCVT